MLGDCTEAQNHAAFASLPPLRSILLPRGVAAFARSSVSYDIKVRPLIYMLPMVRMQQIMAQYGAPLKDMKAFMPQIHSLIPSHIK